MEMLSSGAGKRTVVLTLCVFGFLPGSFAGAHAQADSAMTLADLVTALKTAPDFIRGGEIAEELATRNDRNAIPRIAPMLASEDARTRCNAAWVLAALGDSRGLPTLIDVLSKTRPDHGEQQTLRRIDEERYYAVHVLAKLKDKRVVPVLLEYLDDPRLDYEVAYALGKIGDSQAIPPLKALLSRDGDDLAQTRAVMVAGALMELGDSEGLTVIDRLLHDKSADWGAHRLALQTLVNCPDKQAAFDRLLGALKDPNPDLREAAINELAKLGDKRAIRQIELLLNDTELCTHGCPLEGRPATDFRKVSDAAGRAIRTLREGQKETRCK